jgi:hypothetical protein
MAHEEARKAIVFVIFKSKPLKLLSNREVSRQHLDCRLLHIDCRPRAQMLGQEICL